MSSFVSFNWDGLTKVTMSDANLSLTTVVPEAWAMMVLGFGLIGFKLRNGNS
jgi:hypothetical protein